MTEHQLLLASNRGPRSFRIRDDGEVELAGTGGGLAGTLHPLLAGTGATWIAASMSEADRVASENGHMAEDGLRVVTIDVEPALYRQAYDVVSNATLWFCHHHLFDAARRPRLDRHWHQAWDAYREVNQRFAQAIAEEAREGSVVLVQDYHLNLVGALVAKERPDLATVHFTHTPFADPELLRVLPDRVVDELHEGMAGFGACGFHTARWEGSFRAGYRAGGPVAPPATFAAPLGPDPDSLASEAASPAVGRARAELEAMIGDRRLIVRVDRVELSKNILRGFWAFDELLEDAPEWRGAVVMLAFVYPSRESLADYLAYRAEVEHAAARINERWGSADWTPIVLDVADDRDRSVAALTRYDVLLVNPVRDGLNLVAKEGPLLNTVDGVVVLSRDAGAWVELESGVVTINPFDVRATAEALHSALGMEGAERAERAARLRRLVAGRTASDWLADQLAAARGARGGPGPR